MSFDDFLRRRDRKKIGEISAFELFEAGAASRQSEIDKLKALLNSALKSGQEVASIAQQMKQESSPDVINSEREMNAILTDENAKLHIERDALQKRLDVSEKLRDAQFEKLWSLTQAIQGARNGADEVFDLFLRNLSYILKGE